MNLAFAKDVADAFDRLVPTELPPFTRLMSPLPRLGIAMFGTSVSNDLHFFLFVTGASGRDEFTIEIAWSTVSEFPITQRPCPIFDARGELTASALSGASFRQRLNRLWGARRDEWLAPVRRLRANELLGQLRTFAADVGEPFDDCEALKTHEAQPIDDVVAGACNQIRTYAGPFFAEVARVHGHESKWRELWK